MRMNYIKPKKKTVRKKRRTATGALVLDEHTEQRNFVSLFRKTFHPKIIAIPNGGHRSKSLAAKLKLEGVVSGVSDLFVPEWLAWVEMKRVSGGSVSGPQKEWGEYVKSLGHIFVVCRGCNAAMKWAHETAKKEDYRVNHF